MAVTTIDNLPALAALTGAEVLPTSQTLITRKISLDEIKAYALGAKAPKLLDIATAIPVVATDFATTDTLYLFSLVAGGNLVVTLPDVATFLGSEIKLLIQTDIAGLQYTVGTGVGVGKFADNTVSRVFAAESTTLRVVNNHWVVV